MEGFTSPPASGYEILVARFHYAHEPEGGDPRYWHVVDIRLFGRSITSDLKKISGDHISNTVYPSFLRKKEEALAAGARVVELHRERCYTIDPS